MGGNQINNFWAIQYFLLTTAYIKRQHKLQNVKIRHWNQYKILRTCIMTNFPPSPFAPNHIFLSPWSYLCPLTYLAELKHFMTLANIHNLSLSASQLKTKTGHPFLLFWVENFRWSPSDFRNVTCFFLLQVWTNNIIFHLH